MNDIFATPRRYDRIKKFVRKPLQRSQRSCSRKSVDGQVKEIYIKSPASTQRDRKDDDFFTTLATSLISQTPNGKGECSRRKYKYQLSDRKMKQDFDERTDEKSNNLASTYQAQIELKNHEIGVISGQVKRARTLAEQQKSRRNKAENERKELSRELKQTVKMFDNSQIEIKKLLKQKEHLMKQIEFLEKINYDEKTRSLQSYREKYLEEQVKKLKQNLKKNRNGKQEEFLSQIRTLSEEKHVMESSLKALKVANQCMIRQISQMQSNIHQIILNSEQYKKLRDKYIKFLEEYKLLRNEYWSLKAEMNSQHDSSSFLLSITSDEIESDLCSLKKNSFSSSSVTSSSMKGHPMILVDQRQNESFEPTYGNPIGYK